VIIIGLVVSLDLAFQLMEKGDEDWDELPLPKPGLGYLCPE